MSHHLSTLTEDYADKLSPIKYTSTLELEEEDNKDNELNSHLLRQKELLERELLEIKEIEVKYRNIAKREAD
jgi:hypothetical protein